MNAKLRGRAEALLVLQECGAMTDRQTLNGAIVIAHHGKRFQEVPSFYHEYFDELARMMREKFPKCPCKACVKRNSAAA